MRSPGPRIPPSAPLLLVAALAAPAGCAAEAAARREPDPALTAELRRIDESRGHIDDASRAVSGRRYADARALLDRASALGVDAHRYEIGELREKLDRREAKLWANEAAELLEQGDCEAAFRLLSARIAELGSEAFAREARRLVGRAAVACASAQVDAATIAGRFAEARAFLAAAPTRTVLGAAGAERLTAELDATIAEALYGQIEADVAAGRWAAAVEAIEAAVARGDAPEEQGRALVGRVREAAAPRLAELAGKAVGARGAAAALERIDAAIARLGWEPVAAALPGSDALPEPLARRRAALAAWVEAVRLQMRPMKRPSMRWSHGTVAVAPPSDADGPPAHSLAPSTAVWVIGQTKQRALVTAVDPGTVVLTRALDAAIGWVPLLRLAPEPTLDWLPPDDQMKGARVWGPLREGQPTLELGVVSEVRGADVIVRRLADDAEIPLPRRQLRSGRLAPGTRVLALCEAENQPATIVEVPPTGRVARIQCDGGTQKDEPLASLRARPDFLPRRGR
ncbi:hypothetical protein SOCEGT47_036070 [Sorangium cellulosum]|uniref:Secreted protein n=1 Tax=Sorangium cellulosum TaxID=56 RepID=A0A4P2Q2A1_SORCE|nr:hypothetical protein [Sorangium cellulosum]AUX23088.1 hypothetical protein SOCEGT47_036070 [Sorangium cellulosum]